MRPAGRSFWLDEAFVVDRGEAPPLSGETRADVCIVGGGYTGLWTALRLKELDRALTVAVIDADVCGGGASGRNGGFVLSWWAKFSTLLKRVGADEALALARASEQAVIEIGEFCRRHDIDAHYRHDGWLWTATSAAQQGAWTSTVADTRRHGADPFRELAADDVARLAGSAQHLAGVFEASAATVQPALLARGMRRVALERGVHMFENTPMLELERSRPLRVRTPGGVVVADRVVLAVDSWSALLRELGRAFFVVSSDIVVTEAAPDQLEKIGWTNGMSISDSRSLVNYYRTTLDGRIAFGRGGGRLAFGGDVGRAFDGVSTRASDVEAHFRRLYPQLDRTAVVQSWQGPVGRTPSGLPCFGHLRDRPDITYGFGYSGNGVGPSYVGGRILASLALGLSDEWSSNGLARGPGSVFPPEPIRYFAGRVVRAAVARKEAAEDAGQSPSALDVRLAALAPKGLVPTRR
jgi:putative aminophosphonate oxidoreductase